MNLVELPLLQIKLIHQFKFLKTMQKLPLQHPKHLQSTNRLSILQQQQKHTAPKLNQFE